MAGLYLTARLFEQTAVGADIVNRRAKGRSATYSRERMVRRGSFIYGEDLSADVRLNHGLQLTTSFLLMKLPESVYVFFS